MPYAQLDPSGAIVGGLFANPQSFATQWLDDSDPAVVAFKAANAPKPSLTFLQFMALFTPAEQTAIVGSADIQVRLFTLMASGAGTLQLSNAEVIQGVNYLASIALLTAPRAAAVLAGQAPAS